MSFDFNPFTGNFDLVDHGLWDALDDTVNASSTKVVDTIVFNDFKSVTYEVTMYNVTEGEYKKITLVAIKDGTDVKDSVAHRIGSLNGGVSFDKVGLNVELSITNNESFEIVVEIAKLLAQGA